MDKFEETNVKVNMWLHDMNATVNKEVKSRGINNQNDLWHGVKNVKKLMKKITDGAKKNHGKTWHQELDDKLLAVTTHVHWATRNCAGDPTVLRQNLDNIIPHYENNHENCNPSSRCKSQDNYQPTKKVITNPIAKQLLEKVVKSCTIYKNASSFAYAKDTHYVESFNNVINICQDKRISFSSEEYRMRSYLAVLHWNENVDRAETSVWVKPSGQNRRGKTKKI